MKSTKLLIITALLAFSLVRPLFADEIKMLFWYPGEAGTTEIAQPTLDALFDYINKEIAPDTITGKYFNTIEGGLAFIRSKKPDIAIISRVAFETYLEKLPPSIQLLKTLPLPAGKDTEEYVIVGLGGAPSGLDVPIYSKQPITPDFVNRYIFPGFAGPKIEIVANILPLLKDISSGAKKGGAILQPVEYYTLKSIDQPWAKSLKVWKISKPIPSAPLLRFGKPTPAIVKIKDALLKIGTDPEGKQILETLRLEGFAQ